MTRNKEAKIRHQEEKEAVFFGYVEEVFPRDAGEVRLETTAVTRWEKLESRG